MTIEVFNNRFKGPFWCIKMKISVKVDVLFGLNDINY